MNAPSKPWEPTPETFDLIRELEEQIIDPATRHDPEILDRIIADSLLEFSGAGIVYDKPSVIAAMKNEGGAVWVAMDNRDYQLRALAENLLLLTYRHSGTLADGRQLHSLRSSIWTLIDGRWQLIFHQGTPTAAQA